MYLYDVEVLKDFHKQKKKNVINVKKKNRQICKTFQISLRIQNSVYKQGSRIAL